MTHVFNSDRYVNPYTDFGFKMLFGTEVNKELLISFVNSLLQGKEVIKDLTYLNTEHLNAFEFDRKSIFDVYCENEKGEKILVEMQRGELQNFKANRLYYTPPHNQGPEKQEQEQGWDFHPKAVYVIGILNFVFYNKQNDYFHHEVKLMDSRTQEAFYDKLTFMYLEMPKFNKTEDQLETLLDKWLFVLRNLTSLPEPPTTLQDHTFKCLFEVAEISNLTMRQYEAYEKSLKTYRDWKAMIEAAYNRGLAEGLAEAKAIAEGRKKGLPK